VTQDPRTAQERAVELLRATLAAPSWLPDTEAKRLVWAIRCALVLGVLILVASVVDKGLWDWLDLLIVPAVLAIGGYLLSGAQNRATQAAAERRTQDEALQAYLDRMGQLLIDQDLLDVRGRGANNLRSLARSYTLTVLGSLDGRRKREVVRFLYETGLIYADPPPAITLHRADLTGADLEGMGLCTREYTGADLLGMTDLRARAERLGVGLNEIARPRAPVHLAMVDLSSANLRGADLGGANLTSADLSGADLRGANLSYAHLDFARGISAQQLHEQCKVLVGATMPNRQEYEEWRGNRERQEEDSEDG
jgi:uncharacterized protein YjbI with pentapeptide repeats